MKKHKMLISLAGLAIAVASIGTVTAYTLGSDGSRAPVGESTGTQEPAFRDDKLPTFDPAPNTIDDGKGGVSVINPDVKGDGQQPLHGDPPPPAERPVPQPVDGTDVPGTEPVIEPIEPGEGSGEVVAVTPPKDDVDDVEDVGTEVVRVGPGTGLLIDPLLATGAEVKLTGEVVSEGIFSVDGMD